MAGDLLMQRFKAVEMSVSDGHWKVATHLELIATSQASASTGAEREQAANLELAESRVRDLAQSRGQQSGGRGRNR